MVCIELEDGVGPDQKDLPATICSVFLNRQHIFKRGTRAEVVVRINHPDTDEGKADLQAIYLCGPVQWGDDS